MSAILNKFPKNAPGPVVTKGEGVYLHTADGRRLLDTTAGNTSLAVLGWGHRAVLDAMTGQMEKFCHVDINVWTNPMLEELGQLLLSQAPAGLNRVYYVGNSGSEAMEAAMKLSYQAHHDAGNPGRSWFISRRQSFHGATLHGVGVSELPILHFYQPLLPAQLAQIEQHNPYLGRHDGESLEEYAARGARELEEKILEIGPDNVAAFIGETQLGSLVGDVPAAPGYWKAIRAVCDTYGIHLILDEIYCGLGRSGKIYNIAWDGVTPDFIAIGKNLGAGYAPLSAVITNDSLERIVTSPTGQGRIQHGHTHQGYSLGAAAALAVQKIVHSPEMLAHINTLGQHMRDRLTGELGDHPFFRNVRGRGLLFSIEHDCDNKNGFAQAVSKIMLERHQVIINAKWHRTSFTPPYTLTREQADFVLDGFIGAFREVAAGWAK